MQTGDRLTYYPNTAFAELSTLEQKLASVPGAIQFMQTATESSPEFAEKDSAATSDQANAKLAAYKSTITTAMAHIADISVAKPQASLDKPASGQSKIPER